MPNPNDPNNPFGKAPNSWSDEDSEPQAPTPPQAPAAPPVPGQSAPGQDEQDLATQFVGKMTRIGPDVYIDDSTASLLTALKALGLPMGSQAEIEFLGTLFTGSSVLTDNLYWFGPKEYEMLLGWLSKLPNKISYSISMRHFTAGDPAVELLKSLIDLQFEIASDSPKTQTLLKLIAGSHSQSSPIAQQILAMDPASMAKLIDSAYPPLGNDPLQQINPPVPEGQSDLQNVMRKHHPDIGQPMKPAAPPPPGAPPTPPAQSSNPEIRMTMPEVNKWGIEPMPAGNFGTGAQAKSKQIADFANKYEDMAKNVPQDVKPVPYGEKIPRQQVYGQGGGTLANVPVTGGMMLKDYEDVGGKLVAGADAMAIGLAPDGKLAVRLFPGGEYDIWDLMTRTVRLSNLKAPKRDY